MTGVEVLAGVAVGYLVRKLRRVGGRADAEVDRALDEGMDALHGAITRRLGQDQVLQRLETEAADGAEPTALTVRRSGDAIAQAALDDPGFAGELEALVARLDKLAAAADPAPSPGSTVNTVSHSTVHGPVIQGRDFTGPVTIGSQGTTSAADEAGAGKQGKAQPPAR
ncbi:hypothetical protein BTM25_11520 [Actinomadura rubteroloni]|uniref:Chromosome partitioning protein n=1 Tax=Actinomadura rubteroloni TaxID=1926885 RepID=A0A2P4UNX9_9ACTN|nr:chromosome partitioning protein [Actinomadura rubteroloni]POM26746.1 hypothetical protein BTM25_11520 [Actinomadura rubteroloni]